MSQLLHTEILRAKESVVFSTVRQFAELTVPCFERWHQTVRDILDEQVQSIELVPMRENFLFNDVVGHFCEPTEHEGKTERNALVVEIDGNIVSIMSALNELDPELYELWEGAWGALHSSIPDRKRHALVSARELVTQVLHKLAPDHEMAAWDIQREYYDDKGRPTRAGRLRFIYSQIASRELQDYLDADIKSSLKLIDLFNAATHSVKFPITERQLRKAHSLICSLIEIALRNKQV